MKRRPGTTVAFAPVTTHFVPFLLRAAHIAPGMRVLDIATGTGLAAEAALRRRQDGPRHPRRRVALCAKKCGAISVIQAGQSQS